MIVELDEIDEEVPWTLITSSHELDIIIKALLLYATWGAGNTKRAAELHKDLDKIKNSKTRVRI